MDTSHRGELGSLWLQGEVPSWFDLYSQLWSPRRGIKIQTGHEFLSSDMESVPDLVCWYLPFAGKGRELEVEIDRIRNEMKLVLVAEEKARRHMPGIVVYAPGISGSLREELVLLGAIVYTESPDRQSKPVDVETFRTALTERMEQAYEGWVRDPQGLWRVTDARANWRDGPGIPLSAAETTDSIASSPELDSELMPHEMQAPDKNVTAEHYKTVLKYLESGGTWAED
jgi:hypothetical protein